MKVQQFKFHGKFYTVKALKATGEALVHELHRLAILNHYWIEVTGIRGETEDRHQVMALYADGDGAALIDPAYWTEILPAFAAKIPAVIDDALAQRLASEARELFRNYIPVVDKTRTEEQVAAEAEASRQAIEEAAMKRAEQNAAFLAEWAEPGTFETRPDGMMAVTISQHYDNSDAMTDYFSPHTPYGPDYLVGIVAKQAQTQALARSVIARYPELARLTWSWHTETYSGGHGNYLMSANVGNLPETVQTYGPTGTRGPAWWWEIEFNGYSKESYPCFRGYTEAQKALPPAVIVDTGAITAGQATVRRNEAHNGVEIVFPGKPPQEVLGQLHAAGFRWSPRQRLWYARYSDHMLARANEIAAQA